MPKKTAKRALESSDDSDGDAFVFVKNKKTSSSRKEQMGELEMWSSWIKKQFDSKPFTMIFGSIFFILFAIFLIKLSQGQTENKKKIDQLVSTLQFEIDRMENLIGRDSFELQKNGGAISKTSAFCNRISTIYYLSPAIYNVVVNCKAANINQCCDVCPGCCQLCAIKRKMDLYYIYGMTCACILLIPIVSLFIILPLAIAYKKMMAALGYRI